MTELREALKPKPGEDAVAYAERAEAALERHHKETGERLSAWSILPGEGPGEVLERDRKLSEADKIRRVSRERARGREATQREENYVSKSVSADDSSRSYRIKSQERDVEKAIATFEESKKRLYRRDGSKVYGEAEHSERLSKLTSELSERVEQVIAEAQEDAQGYETEALRLSYTDPTKGLTSTERERLTVSLPLVREDCEGMALPALIERLKAVAVGSDEVAKFLHARYGRSRAEGMERKMAESVRAGGSVSVDDAAALRGLQEAVSELDAQLEDEDTKKRREAAREAASKSRQLAVKLRRRRSEADGTDERVREEYRQRLHSTI